MATPNASSSQPAGATTTWRRPRIFNIIVAFFVLMVVVGVLLGPVGSSIPPGHAWGSAAMQRARTISLAMSQYAQDHQGQYPTGRSSTEVFQKLIDGNYVTDPSIFCLKMTGKKAAQSSSLTPENISFDVTATMTDKTSDMVPCVIATGYLIEYKPGGHAIPLADRPQPIFSKDGIAISYHNNDSYFRTALPTGVVTNAIPADANIGPGPYTQLTPDGPLTGN